MRDDEPDTGGHIRDRVVDAVECAQVAERMLATEAPDGDTAIRLHTSATDLGEVVFRVMQATRLAAIAAVNAAGGQVTVDDVTWHVRQEPYSAPTLVRGPRPTRSGGRRTFD